MKMEKEKLRKDYFIDPSFMIYQDPAHFCFNTDTRLLAQFMTIRKNETVIDIGTNNGVLMVYAAKAFPLKKIIGVEVLEPSSRIARLNAEMFIDKEWEVINLPIQDVSMDPVDVILSNPPFFEVSEMHPNTKLDMRAYGRFEINCTLNDLVSHASRLLRSNGRFYFVHRPDRLSDIIQCLKEYRFSIKNLQIAYDHRNNEAKSVLIEAIKEGNTKMKVGPCIWI